MDDVTNATFSNATFQDQCRGDDILDLQFASDEHLDKMMYSSTEETIILSLYPTSLFVGLAGNLAFLAVIAFMPEMRTITNAYLGNLAVADMIFLCALNYDVLIGFLLSPIVKMKPYWSSFGCGFRVYIQFTAHVTIVGLILLVTLERYLGICKPLKHRVIVAKGRTMKLVIAAWSVSLVFAAMVVPSVAVFKSMCIVWPKKEMYIHLPTALTSCNPVLQVFGMFHDVLLIPLLIVLLINMLMYVKIIRELNRRVASREDPSSLQNGTPAFAAQARRCRNQVARLLIATGTFFFFCCVPEFTLHLNKLILTLTDFEVGFKMTPKQQWYVVWLARGMTTMSAVMNPILYGLVNSRYRQAFKKLFTFRFTKEKNDGKNGGKICRR